MLNSTVYKLKITANDTQKRNEVCRVNEYFCCSGKVYIGLVKINLC
jgi:hypothetical protein